jgi:hypothetical protein
VARDASPEQEPDGSSLRRAADALFLLPARPTSVRLVGMPAAWERAIDLLGIERVGAEGVADAVVASAMPAAPTTSAAPILVTGRVGRRRAHRDRLERTTSLVRHGAAGPRLVVPAGNPAVASYAFTRWTPAAGLARRARNWTVARALGAGLVPRSLTHTVLQHEAGEPFLVAAARGVGVDPSGGWFLSLGEGDDLQRGAFHLFGPGDTAPRWVVKTARVPGFHTSFDADERGLSMAHRSPSATAHAPALLGRMTVGGLHASVETAATGRSLHAVLASSSPASRKLALVREVAAWLGDVASETIDEGPAADGERRRLRDEVLPAWGLDGEVADALDGVPMVLQHNDVGPWNVMVDDRFCLVDWESARYGFPLWDLVYFLGYALTLVDGHTGDEHLLRLFRGDHPLTGELRALVGAHADRLQLTPDAVGPLVATTWLHHGLSHRRRTAALAATGARAPEHGGLEAVAQRWAADAALGGRWDAWAG